MKMGFPYSEEECIYPLTIKEICVCIWMEVWLLLLRHIFFSPDEDGCHLSKICVSMHFSYCLPSFKYRTTDKQVEQSSDNRCILANCSRTCLWIVFKIANDLIPDAILFNFGPFLKNSTRVTDGRTDGRTYPLIEMRERIKKCVCTLNFRLALHDVEKFTVFEAGKVLTARKSKINASYVSLAPGFSSVAAARPEWHRWGNRGDDVSKGAGAMGLRHTRWPWRRTRARIRQ